MFLLVCLCHIDDISPIFFVLGLEVPQKVIETLISLRQVLDRRVQRLPFSLLVTFDKPLNFFDFLDCFRPAGVASAQWLLGVVEE